MNNEMLALLVHDIKNQLGVLEAELSLLEAEPEQGRAHRAHQHCAQLRQRLIAYLLMYSGSGNRMTASASDESPFEFLNSLLNVSSRPDGAPLRVDSCEDAPPFWYFDPRLVRIAMEAALHNAWRFARSDVLMSARQSGDFLVLSIDDDGPGLGAEDPSAESSTGLGIELCTAVAKAHNTEAHEGRVELLPRPEGGTRFEMWLP